MHTFLIIGGSLEDRKNKINELITKEDIGIFDIKPLILDTDALSLGIKQVREWQKQLLLMPTASPYTAGVIESANLLTTEAQNAMLKTLEEPPAHTRIYMEAPSNTQFLPTILSRCQIIQLPTHTLIIEKQAQIREQLQTLTDKKTTAGQIILLLDTTIKNKEEGLFWITNAITVMYQTQSSFTKQTYVPLMKRMLLAVKQLSSNVSYKLVLDAVFLSTKH